MRLKRFQKAFHWARNRLFKLVYAGNACFCLFCGKSYRRFMHQGARSPVFQNHRVTGAGFKRNARCPNCGSRPRMRLLHLFFQLRTDLYSRQVRVLHISPHKGIARLLRPRENVDYVCGALHPDRFAELDAVKADVTQIGFPDEGFDVVICNHVLEHVQNDREAMREIHRVLRPGGFAILQVPLALDLETTLEDPTVVSEKERLERYGQKDHLRLYGMDYFQRLGDAGFRVVRDNPFENEWLPDPDRHRLERNEDVILGFKD